MTFQHGDKQRRLIQKDGYCFHRNGLRNGYTRLICKGASQCPVKAKLVGNEVVLTSRIRQHSCRPANSIVPKLEAFQNDLHEAVKNSRRTSWEIYKYHASRHPEASKYYTFARAERSMKNWRSSYRPKIPRTMEEYVTSLLSDKWKEKYTRRGDANLSVYAIRALDGKWATVFIDIEYTRSLPELRHFAMDATFKVCPLKPKILQFFSILVSVDGVWLPVVWSIMQSKSLHSYRAVLNIVKEVFGDVLQPWTVLMDFEPALSSAVMEVFPGTTIIRCFFHHCQAMMKRLSRIKGKRTVSNALKTWPRAKFFFRKLLALALLPSGQIRQSFDDLVNSSEKDINIYFAELLVYYRRWWINRVKPEKYSVFGHSQRTNNAIEAYHRVLGELLMRKHPDIWTFTECILDMIEIVRRDIASLDLGYWIRRDREKKYLIREDMLQEAWNLFVRIDEPKYDKFLMIASHILRPFQNDLCTNIRMISEFKTINHYNEIVIKFPSIHRYRLQRHTMIGNRIFNIEYMLHRTGCIRCRCRYLATFIGIPCLHWFGCEQCTLIAVQLRRKEIICHYCGAICDRLEKLEDERAICKLRRF